MKLKELRESVGIKQRQLVNELQSEGIKATMSDISRIENGAVETYLFLAFRIEEILKRKNIRQDEKNATQAKIRACKCIVDFIMSQIQRNGFTNYAEIEEKLGISNRREIRRAVEQARKEYPLIDLENGGWGLAQTIADCNKQIGIYEKKKRVYSYQETPLIAKRYGLERAMYGTADTKLLCDNTSDSEI